MKTRKCICMRIRLMCSTYMDLLLCYAVILLFMYQNNLHLYILLLFFKRRFLLIFRMRKRKKYKKNLVLEYASTTKVLDWKILTKRSRRKNSLNNFFRGNTEKNYYSLKLFLLKMHA